MYQATTLRCARRLLACLTLLTSAGCSQAVLDIDDVVIVPEHPAFVRVFLERIGPLGVRNGVEDVQIELLADGRRFARSRTNDEGYCQWLIHPPADATGTDISAATVRWRPRLEATARMFSWRADRTTIVVDIDGTISDTDFDDLLLDPDDDGSEPIRHSVRALRKLAETYQIAYVTARPRMTAEKTRRWLRKSGYPRGPVFTTPTLSDLVDRAGMKRTLLARLKKAWPGLLIGIGDKDTDREAYVESGMLTILHSREDRAESRDIVIILPNWKAIEQYFQKNDQHLSNPTRLRAWLAAASISDL